MSAEHTGSDQASEVLAEAIGRLGVVADPQHVEDYLALIVAAAEMEREARTVLHDAVASARSAGATWSTIGATLGMSKQAAQKRFTPHAAPAASTLDPGERILGPVTAFNEMAELALAGRYGWHSVEFGPSFHRVVRSETQWEHARVSMLRGRARSMASDGWRLIGSEFPFAYLKRDLGTPAPPEPGAQP